MPSKSKRRTPTRGTRSRRAAPTTTARATGARRAVRTAGDSATNPELMVIGDSLAQGVRSLSFRPDFASQCVGARLAASQGWDFQLQTHPRPVLFDVEAEVRKLSIPGALFYKKLLREICDRVNQNIEKWMKELVDSPTVRSVRPFDNLAVGGALLVDLAQPASHWREILRTHRGFQLDADDLLRGVGRSTITELFKAINFTYVLNPANNPEWENRSALSWLAERRPKRVLMSIGHNEALWDVGFLAADQDVSIEQLVGLDEIATSLAAIETEWVCWDLLPKVSSVASLEPVGDEWIGSGAGEADNYCERYQPVLTTQGNTLPGTRLKEIDASIRETNVAVRARLESSFSAAGHADQLRFFDDYGFFAEHDFKNQPNPEAPASRKLRTEFEYRKRSQRIDNRYLAAFYVEDKKAQGHGKFIPKIKQMVAGGIQSLDGMHPTGPGYALKAIALSREPGLNLTPIDDPEKLLEQAFAEDTLTADFPTIVNTVRFFLRALQKVPRAVTASGGDDTASVDDEEHACARAWTELMSAPMAQGVTS